MAYNYLLELYEILEKDTAGALEDQEKARQENDPNEIAFAQGKVDMMAEIQQFLEENYNRMLPRKIRERLENHGIQGMT